jgi:SNF2 family DNA or RNA helicase
MPLQPERKSMEPELLDDVVFYPHQIDGIRRLAKIRSFLLADDMGLGKSLQALALFVLDYKMYGEGRGAGIGIVVCPVTLKDNWENEIRKFTRIKCMVLGNGISAKTGRRRILNRNERMMQIVEFAMWTGPKILICNYEQVLSHGTELNALKARIAIFDEAHYMKNPESKRTKACLEIDSYRSFMLTGTPLLNNVTELWPLLHRIAPEKFNNAATFNNRYAVYGGNRNTTVVETKNVKELNAILERVMVRRLKKDVLKLPIPYITQISVPLNETQRRLYDLLSDEYKLESIDPEGDDIMMKGALAVFLRQKQICGTPYSISFDSKDPEAPQYPDESYKLDLVVDKAKEMADNGEKVVIFTQFRGVVDALIRRFNATGIPAMQLHGDVKATDRQSTVDRWGEYEGPCMLVCMSQVAGIGLNMIAGSVCFFVDKLFVPGLNQQCIDRLWRIGASETQPVQVFEFIARGTIEDRIEEILKAKILVNEDIVERSDMMRRLLRALREADKRDKELAA